MKVSGSSFSSDVKELLSQMRRNVGTPATKASDKASDASTAVAISETGRRLASAAHPSNGYAKTLDEARRDPRFAKREAERFAYDESWERNGPLVDISHDPIRYAATGEVVTPESLATFKSEAAKVTSGRIALYQAEKAKGTPDALILEKLYSFVDAQSENYRSKLNWVGIS